MTVARASGRTLRETALDPFDWTARAFLELDDLARLERAAADLRALEVGGHVAYAFHNPSGLAELRHAALSRALSAQARALGIAPETADARIDARIREVEAVIDEIAALEAAGHQWRPASGAS